MLMFIEFYKQFNIILFKYIHLIPLINITYFYVLKAEQQNIISSLGLLKDTIMMFWEKAVQALPF